MAIFSRDDGRKDGKKARSLPLLPLRDIIVFPHMVVPLFVGRRSPSPPSRRRWRKTRTILLCRPEEGEDERARRRGHLRGRARSGTIIQLLRLPDGTVKVLVEGKQRARVKRFLDSERFLLVEAEEIEEQSDKTVELEALMRSVQSTFEAYVKLNKRIPPEMLMLGRGHRRPGAPRRHHRRAPLPEAERQAGRSWRPSRPRSGSRSSTSSCRARSRSCRSRRRSGRASRSRWRRRRRSTTSTSRCRPSRRSSGERDEFKNEIQELEEKIKNKRMSKEATLKAKKELKKLKMMSPMSAEATVVRNYIDWILSLPWYEYTEDKLDIAEAEKILDEDHYGLKKAKERILEYLAVQTLVEKIKGPILCFVGPPGVGKTSLAQSIARATGRRVRPHLASAACATRPRSAATGARTSARCPARSSSR